MKEHKNAVKENNQTTKGERKGKNEQRRTTKITRNK